MINSRNINDLLHVVQPLVSGFIAECLKEGIDVIITSTFRDIESQNALYAQGRTTPGAIVTNAKGGMSFHNYRCAFDFCPIVGGKAMWGRPDLFEKCGEIGEKLGLTWAGRWTSFKEMAHCQYTNGLTIHDLQAGKVPA